MRLFRFRRCLFYFLGLSFLLCMLLGIRLISKDEPKQNREEGVPQWLNPEAPKSREFGIGGSSLLQKMRAGVENDNRVSEPPADTVAKHVVHVANDDRDAKSADAVQKAVNNKTLNYNVHVFYYVWYGNPEHDDSYLHWAHQRIPHWDKNIAKKYPTNYHSPPDDIGSNYYPQLGPYSSRDEHVIDEHMQQIVSTGAGVLSVSWYPPGQSDDNCAPWDDVMLLLLDAAHRYNLKICFHIEPFTGRSAAMIQHWVKYIIDTYGQHPSFYRIMRHGKELPLFYMYDSYQVEQAEWRDLLVAGGRHSVRNTPYDGVFIGLLVEKIHQKQLEESGFDGYYTYFASNGFTYGSTTHQWRSFAKQAAAHDKLFIPSVGPGYVDDRVRPWNKRNTKERKQGEYYRDSFSDAIASKASLISITSFNEWHEGTQIERAVPKRTADYTYLDYSPHDPDYYLQLTKQFVDLFSHSAISKH